MRIGIDARYIQDYFPGIGRYTFSLINALAKAGTGDTFVVFFNSRMENSRFDLNTLASPSVVLLDVDIPTFSTSEQWKLPFILKKAKLDVYYSPYYIKPYLTPCPSVVTIHDASGARFPQYLLSARARILFKTMTRLASASSKLVITDSNFSKEDLVRFFGIPETKIRVVYPAAAEFAGESAGHFSTTLTSGRETSEDDPFILYVGIDKPHKNLSRLVHAYAKSGIQQKLYIVGRHDPRFPQTRQDVEKLGIKDRVNFTGEIADAELTRLFKSADFFVFPSLCEGFGLPVLEAMASGLPVVVSNSSSLPEVVGEAGILIDPLNTEQWTATLSLLAKDADLRVALGKKGAERAKLFSWKRTAEQVLAVFREASSR